MRGAKAKRLRKLGLKSGPVMREPVTGVEKMECEARQALARWPYENARRARGAGEMFD